MGFRVIFYKKMISKGNVFYPKQWWGVDLCLKESLNVGSVFLVNLNFFQINFKRSFL
jgi:hypothetical protein